MLINDGITIAYGWQKYGNHTQQQKYASFTLSMSLEFRIDSHTIFHVFHSQINWSQIGLQSPTIQRHLCFVDIEKTVRPQIDTHKILCFYLARVVKTNNNNEQRNMNSSERRTKFARNAVTSNTWITLNPNGVGPEPCVNWRWISIAPDGGTRVHSFIGYGPAHSSIGWRVRIQ